MRLETVSYHPSSVLSADEAIWSTPRMVYSIVTATFVCVSAAMIMVNYSRMSISRHSLHELKGKFRDDLHDAVQLLNDHLFKEQWQLHQIQSMVFMHIIVAYTIIYIYVLCIDSGKHWIP